MADAIQPERVQEPGPAAAADGLVRETRSTADPGLHRIVVVGGGAGGLELATRLGDTLGRRRRAAITLVDRSLSHLWKPLLHQVASGTRDPDTESVEYLAEARWHRFRYRLGAMDGLDREKRCVYLAPVIDEDGREVTPRRFLPYDTLVVAVGSGANYFGTPGAAEHAIALETKEEAERFNRRVVNACIRADAQHEPLRPGQLHVAIIGAGATGVELAAELHRAMRELASFGLDNIDFDKAIRITVIEAGERILPALPERLSEAVAELLHGLGVAIRTGTKVTAVTAEGVLLAGGEFLPAELVVWAAGIKAPEFLAGLDGLETDRVNRLVVRETLQTTRDENIFALGDCAACPLPGSDRPVPPRAQAAHQEAAHLAKSLRDRLAGRPLRKFVYRDFGSLVSLSKYSAIGNLMGGLIGGSLRVEGLIARLMYRSLYLMHLRALHGTARVVIDLLARLITRGAEPRVKLH
jgi:NADH dehydrogenase